MYSIRNIRKLIYAVFTAVIIITAVSLFAKQTGAGAANAVTSISVTPVQATLDGADKRTVYRFDSNSGKYVSRSYYDVYDYDKIRLTVNYGTSKKTYTGSEITRLTASLGMPLVISDGQVDKAWGTGNHTVTYRLGNAVANATFSVVSTKIVSLAVTPKYTINAIYNVDGSYRIFADNSGKIYKRFIYDLGDYDYNISIVYQGGTTVNCTAADLKQKTGYEPAFSQGEKELSVGTNTGYCTVGGVTAKFSFNVVTNPVRSVQLYMSGNADTLTAENDGYYAKRSDGSDYFRFIYDKTKIRAKVTYTSGSVSDYAIGELCAKLHGQLEISDMQSVSPWSSGTVTLPATINGIKTSLTLKVSGVLPITELSCRKRTSNTIVLSWSKNELAAGYIVERYADGKWVRMAKLASNTAVSYEIGSLAAGTTYRFRIKAYKGSSYSAYAYADVDTLPAAVDNFRRTGRTASTVTLSWNKNTSADGYCVEQYKSGKWTQIAKISGNSAVNYTASGLTASTTCKFRIRAYRNTAKATDYSDYVTVAVNTLPANVSNFRCTGRTKNSVTLSWNKNTTADGYIIQQYVNGKWVQKAKLSGSSSVSYTVTGLTPATSYNFRIQAYKTIGVNTVYSGYTSHTTLSSPVNVSGLVCTARTYNSITLGWNRNSAATGYKLEQYKNGKWVMIALIKSNKTTSYKVTGLAAATGYKFRIRAYKSSGSVTAHSGYTTYQTLSSPTNVTSFKATKRSGTSVTLGWNKNTTATGYKVEQYKNGKWVQIAVVSVNKNVCYTVSKLSRNTAYRFRIRAYKTISGKTSHSGYAYVNVRTTK